MEKPILKPFYWQMNLIFRNILIIWSSINYLEDEIKETNFEFWGSGHYNKNELLMEVMSVYAGSRIVIFTL